MLTSKGFLSYVHADDQAENGRISQLATNIQSQFEMLTGETLNLFLDRDAIKWGNDWRQQIDSNLSNVTFFIPVLTPRYFISAECRRELQFFIRQAKQLGVLDLVLPIYYVDVPQLHNEDNTDNLVSLVRNFQWEDWREIRFLDSITGAYRKAVHVMASRISEANKLLDGAVIANLTESNVYENPLEINSNEGLPGILDQLAAAEESFPKLISAIEKIAKDIELIGEHVNKSTADIHKADTIGKGYAARLLIAKRLSSQLNEPAIHIQSLSNEYVTQLHEVDSGFKVIIELAAEQVKNNPETSADVCGFFKSISDFSLSARTGLDSIESMLDAMSSIENMSRDLRPVLRILNQGLTKMVEAREVSDEWITLIKQANVKCDAQ